MFNFEYAHPTSCNHSLVKRLRIYVVIRLHAIRHAKAPVRDGVRKGSITEAKLNLTVFYHGGALRTPSLKIPAGVLEFMRPVDL